jgi:hypothetical protein
MIRNLKILGRFWKGSEKGSEKGSDWNVIGLWKRITIRNMGMICKCSKHFMIYLGIKIVF